MGKGDVKVREKKDPYYHKYDKRLQNQESRVKMNVKDKQRHYRSGQQRKLMQIWLLE